jgi:hypothetical protein
MAGPVIPDDERDGDFYRLAFRVGVTAIVVTLVALAILSVFLTIAAIIAVG